MDGAAALELVGLRAVLMVLTALLQQHAPVCGSAINICSPLLLPPVMGEDMFGLFK